MNDLREPTEKRIKQRDTLNRFLDTPVEFLIRHNFTPNIISYIGLMCSIGAALFIAFGTIHLDIWFAWPAPFLIFMAGAFDVFDGEVARRTGKEGPAGAFLDSNLDRLSDAILILGLIYGGFVNYFWGFFILFLCIMISYTRSRAENEGINMKGVGLMERAERVLTLFGVLIIETWVYFISKLIFGEPWIVFNPLVTSIPVTWFFLIFIIIYISLLIYTLGQRLIYTYNKLNNLES